MEKDPEFGPGLSTKEYEAEINAVADKLNSYNTQLSSIDQTLNELQDLERALTSKNGRILAATKGRFGPDSTEYEQVGGTRTSDRKRPGRKSKKGASKQQSTISNQQSTISNQQSAVSNQPEKEKPVVTEQDSLT